MTEPMERLRIAGGSIERQVLDSASADVLSEDARARLTAAVLGSAALVGAAQLGTEGAVKAVAAKGVLATTIKWGVILGLACGAGVALHAIYNKDPAPVERGVAVPAQHATSPLEAPSVVAPAPVETEVPVPSPSPSASPSAERPSRQASSPAAGSSSSSAGELRRIDAARSALERGDAAQAVLDLDAYERTYPAGAFRQEAEVLRVDAYVARGDRAAAVRAAEAFVRRNPTSPYAVRLRALTGDAAP